MTTAVSGTLVDVATAIFAAISADSKFSSGTVDTGSFGRIAFSGTKTASNNGSLVLTSSTGDVYFAKLASGTVTISGLKSAPFARSEWASNFNNSDYTGVFSWQPGATNLPEANSYGVGVNFKSNGWVMQLAMTTNNNWYGRAYVNGSWTNWKTIKV